MRTLPHHIVRLSRTVGWLLIGMLFIRCEEVVNPQLIAAPPIYVIDGWLFPETEDNRVLLSFTAPFNSQEPNAPVSDALVIVRDNRGTANIFREQGGPGVYLPVNPNFNISSNTIYTLQVNVGGADYRAEISPVVTPPIDSLTWRSIVDPTDDIEDGNYITIHFQDPLGTSNFYLWEIWKNGAKISDGDINITSDEPIDGVYLDLELSSNPDYRFEIGDTVTVRLHSLTQKAFEYYQAVKLLTEFGSPAQATPDNPQTNLNNLANSEPVLGFFNATLPTSDTIIIQ